MKKYPCGAFVRALDLNIDLWAPLCGTCLETLQATLVQQLRHFDKTFDCWGCEVQKQFYTTCIE